VYNSLTDEDPSLLFQLASEKILHERSGDSRSEYPIRKEGDEILLNWNYFCVSQNISDKQRNLVERFQHYLLTSALIKQHIQAVKLQCGKMIRYCMIGMHSVPFRHSEKFL
jgi:hypothetical protein